MKQNKITSTAKTIVRLALPVALAILSLGAAMTYAHAETKQAENYTSEDGKGAERNFYQVLEDLMGDFEFDLRNGNVSGVKDLSIRNIATSENIPPSFKNHLELLITERILRNTRGGRVIQCLPCRSKRTTLNGDQVVISSPETNPAELSRIAKLSGIAHFMDVAYSYQPSGMVLSMFITDPETGAALWSRSYNSETSRASAFRRGVDYTQIDDARRMNEYIPTIQYRATIYYMFEPNIGTQTGCIGAGFRMMERYDNRKKEVGFELNYFMDSSSIVGGTTAAAASTNLYSSVNITLLFMHGWNMIGDEENFNKVRGNLFAGIGGTYASGFLGGLGRVGYEWRLGKHFAVSANVGYRPPSTAFTGTTSLGSVGGAEFGAGISLML